MIRRAQLIIGKTGKPGSPVTGTGTTTSITWAGTFHSVANRLLRLHASSIGLDPSFTVLDREDSADLIDLLRNQLGLAKTEKRFPRKATCLAIYSRTVNAQEPLGFLSQAGASLVRGMGKAAGPAFLRVRRRQARAPCARLRRPAALLVDDDVRAAARGEASARASTTCSSTSIRTPILCRPKSCSSSSPTGTGVTVVGDDAQSIYSFRAASVRNILDFPNQYRPPAAVITLEQNYRSSQPILDASNAVIGLAKQRFTKDLFSDPHARAAGHCLVTVHDEAEQVRYVAEQVLAQREAGLALKRQAVLFRAAHHSDALEVELARRNIPFVKYGGLRFLEAAHVKDMMGILRWAENPRDSIAAFRSLQLLAGVGPAGAGHAWQWLEDRGLRHANPARLLASWRRPIRVAVVLRPHARASYPGRGLAGPDRAACDAGTSRDWKPFTATPTRGPATSNN